MNRIVILSALLFAVALGMLQAGHDLYRDYAVIQSDGQLSVHMILFDNGGQTNSATLAIDENTDEMYLHFGKGDAFRVDTSLSEEILKEGVLQKLITGAAGIRIDGDSCLRKFCTGEITS